MYTGMSALQEPSLVVQRGMALHKMIRTVTMVGGGCAEGRCGVVQSHGVAPWHQGPLGNE